MEMSEQQPVLTSQPSAARQSRSDPPHSELIEIDGRLLFLAEVDRAKVAAADQLSREGGVSLIADLARLVRGEIDGRATRLTKLDAQLRAHRRKLAKGLAKTVGGATKPPQKAKASGPVKGVKTKKVEGEEL